MADDYKYDVELEDAPRRKSSVVSYFVADQRAASPIYDEAPPFDEKSTKRLLRKLDYHLVPFLALLYL